jgi:DNA-binding NarL/FixJ family response regulator
MKAAHVMTNDLTFRSVLIIDDHPLFCDALVMTLQSILPDAETILSADRMERALTLLQTTIPDIILLDLNLPDVEGLSGLQQLRRSHPGIPVVVVSSMADNRMIGSCIRSGAMGFIPKHADRTTFETAFQTLQTGNRFVPDGYIEPEETADSMDSMEQLASLTNQQARILELICEGKLNKQIAFDLSIAETTVKAHVTAIMRKLGVQSRTQAVLFVQEANLSKLLQGDTPTD